MKKFLVILTMLFLLVLSVSGCNPIGSNYEGYDFIDTNYHFNYAILKTPNGEIIEGRVLKWADSEGEQLTITLDDGNRYLVHAANCTLIERDVAIN